MGSDGSAFPSEHQFALVVSIAEHGGITAAATALGLSQPAVTAQVRAAERALGAALFTRTREGLRPTTIGDAVLAYAHRKHALKRALLAEIADVDSGRAGTLNVGASTTPGEYYAPVWLARFHAAHPRVDVRLWIANSRTTLKRLTNGLVDIAVVGERPELAGVVCEPILTEQIVLFVVAGSRYDRRVVRLDRLREATFVVREPDSATRAHGLRALAVLGVTPVHLMSVSTNEAVIQLVEAGLGIGILSGRAIQRSVADGYLAPVRVRRWSCERTFYLSRVQGTQNRLADQFRSFVFDAP